MARPHIELIVADLPALGSYLAALARRHGEAPLGAHRRLRKALRMTGVTQQIEPKLPVDILGVYVYLPVD